MTFARSIASNRNTGIDLLRGLSILFVVLLHINIHFSIGDSFIRDWLPRKLYSVLFWSGYNGVVVFFTLSGYLITLSAIKKWGSLEKVNARFFYLLRAARILPLLCLVLIVLSVLHLLNVPGFTLNLDKLSLGQAVWSTLTFQMNLLQIQVGYLPANWDVLWSISIEESFYLVFPLLCLLVRNEKQFVALLMIFFVVSPWARVGLFPANELGDRNHLAYIDSIAIGCIVALLSVRLVIERWVKVLALTIGATLLVFSFAYKSTIYKLGLTANGLNITILSCATGFVLLWLHNRTSMNTKKSRYSWAYNCLANCGRYSYEIYLTHMFIIILAATIFKSFNFNDQQLIPVILMTVLLCYWLGSVLFRFFSEPLNQAIRRHFKLSKSR